MGELIKIAVLENELEARLVEQILNERSIPYAIRSYHDYAYDGIFQFQKGWGYVLAAEEYKDEIIQIINELRSGKPLDSEEDSDIPPDQ
ncbi:MAG: hypothetical protein ACUVUU_07400 [bacterium]